MIARQPGALAEAREELVFAVVDCCLLVRLGVGWRCDRLPACKQAPLHAYWSSGTERSKERNERRTAMPPRQEVAAETVALMAP